MKHQSLLTAALVFLGFVFAGCVDDPNADPKANLPGGRDAKRVSGTGGFAGKAFAGSVDVNRTAPDGHDFRSVVVGDHGIPSGHAIRALHTHKHGLTQVGYSPLVEGKDHTAYTSGFAAIDVWDDGEKFYACVTHFAGNGGATLVDFTDPAKPKVLSQIDSGMVNSDCQFTDDGKYLFLGAYLGVNTPVGQFREIFRQVPLAGAYDFLANGVSIWDVSDKSKPKYVLFSETGTYHNLFTVTINDVYYLLQTYSNDVYRFEPSGGGKLVHISKTSSMVHDMTVVQHPITGDWILVTGKGSGFVIIDFNNPEKPEDLGVWAPAAGGGRAKGWHEQEVNLQLIDGRAIAVVAGEVGGGTTEPYAIVDISDVRNPILLSEWDVPGKPVSPQPNFFTLGPHEIGVWNGYVTVANYHAGVWLFDIGSAERLLEPVTLGHFYGTEEPALHLAPQNPPFIFNPDHWGSYFDSRGYVVTADWGSGLYILKHAATGTWTAPPNNVQG